MEEDSKNIPICEKTKENKKKNKKKNKQTKKNLILPHRNCIGQTTFGRQFCFQGKH